MKKIVFPLLMVGFAGFQMFGQTGRACDAIMVEEKTIFESFSNEDKSKNLTIIDTKWGADPKTLTFSDLKNSLFANHPLAWDVADDSVLFVIRTYSDQMGMTYTDLLKYNIDTLKTLDSLAFNAYLSDTKRIVAKHVSPLFFYAMRIAYRADTIKGPLYFDLFCDGNGLSVYVYLNDNSTLEEWRFNWYPLSLQTLTRQERGEIYQKDQWEKVSEYALPLDGSFKVFEQADKKYLITENFDIYALDSSAQAVQMTVNIDLSEGNIIVFGAVNDQIGVIPVSMYHRLSGVKTHGQIAGFSKIISFRP